MMNSNPSLSWLSDHMQHLLELNDFLDKNASVSQLNEEFIEHLVTKLDGTASAGDDLFWLTTARINELALFCAGNYADTCEPALAGDLLLNPRRVLVRVKGHSRPFVKERHTPLSMQFGRFAGTPGGVVEWLRSHTISEITVEALLPELYSRLARCGRMTETYLASVRERKTKIANITGILAVGRFKDGKDLVQWLETASEGDRKLMESNFCRFDLTEFFEMGWDVRQLERDPSHKSRFLVDPDGGVRHRAPAHH